MTQIWSFYTAFTLGLHLAAVTADDVSVIIPRLGSDRVVPNWRLIAYPYSDAKSACVASPEPWRDSVVAPVVIVAYNRPNYLSRTLSSVVAYWKRVGLYFPLYVSIDGDDESVRKVVAHHSAQVNGAIKIIQHTPYPDKNGYNRLAQHYKYLLKFFFECMKYPRLIFLEDDLEVAPDFFNYMTAMSKLLEADKTLWCVSAWNDQAVTEQPHHPLRAYRTDFMPGLGWMLRADTGIELMAIWPMGYWDDFMRLAHVRRGRQCVFPEATRTYSFGKEGTSGGQFWEQYIAKMDLNLVPVHWVGQDLSYLKDDAYKASMKALMCRLPVVTADTPLKITQDSKLIYESPGQYMEIAKRYGLLSEFREGIPRMSYQGIVVAVVDSASRLFFVPQAYFGSNPC